MTERMYLSMLKDEPDVLTVADAARILRLGLKKTYKLVNDKKLSSIKIGGKSIIPKASLISFLLQNEKK